MRPGTSTGDPVPICTSWNSGAASSPSPVITGTCAPAALVPTTAPGSVLPGLPVRELQATALKANSSLGLPAAVDKYHNLFAGFCPHFL